MDIVGIVSALLSGGGIGAVITAYVNKKKSAIDTRKSRAEGIQIEDEIYQSRIEFLKKELGEQKKIIQSYRDTHPDNGVELDAWTAREEKLYQEKLQMEREIFELRGHLKFALKELEICQKMKLNR